MPPMANAMVRSAQRSVIASAHLGTVLATLGQSYMDVDALVPHPWCLWDALSRRKCLGDG